MISKDGIIPSNERRQDESPRYPDGVDPRDHLDVVYDAQPPSAGLKSFADRADQPPPYSAGFTTLAPRVKSEEPAVPQLKNGKQPVFHVKITARPIKNLTGQRLSYNLSAAPTDELTSGNTVTHRITPEAGAVVHCLPVVQPESEVGAQQSPQSAPVAARRGEAPVHQLSNLEGIAEGNVSAVVHAYKGDKPLPTGVIAKKLLSELNVMGTSPAELDMPSAAPSAVDARNAGIPDYILRAREQDELKAQPPAQRQYWWDANSKELESLTQAERDQLASQAARNYKHLKYGKQTTVDLETATPAGEGEAHKAFKHSTGEAYTKVIPGLIDSADQTEHTVFNWIVPDENAEDVYDQMDSAMLDVAGHRLDRLPYQRGNTSNLMRFLDKPHEDKKDETERRGFSLKNLFGFGGRRSSSASGVVRRPGAQTDEPHPPLHFQDSGKLAEFLNKDNLGLIWEQREDPRPEAIGHPSVRTQEDGPTQSGAAADDQVAVGCCGPEEEEDEPPLRPSVVYGGVEHDAPRYAGDLEPLTMRLHATEIHQFVKVAGMPDPWLVVSRADPAHHAIHGPIALPWNPKFTGMPAPTLADVKKYQCATIDLAPAVADLFDPELPIEYKTSVIQPEA